MNRLLFPSFMLVLCLLLDGCDPDVGQSTTSATSATYRPIYGSYDQIRTVETQSPQPIRTPGKIYVKDGFLFINDVGRGIHIVDNRNPANPVKLSFVAVPGARELAIKDSILYVDNLVDLVALNVADPRKVRLVKRLENAFPYTAYPPMQNVRFECPDTQKGLVVGWEKANLADPQCYR